MRFVILGAGHGGVAMSADLTRAGHQVNLFQVPKFEEGFKKIKETQSIIYSGVFGEGTAQLNKATTNIGEAMEDVEHVIIVAPAFAQEDLADLCIPYLKEGQTVFVVPGGFGSFIISKKIAQSGRKGFTVAETSTLPYGTRMEGDNKIKVHIRTVNLPMGVIPSTKTAETVGLFKKLFPETTACGNALDAALSNTNPIIHVSPSILNTGRIEFADDFYLYREGMTPSVRRVMVAADRERIAVRKALNMGEPHYALDPESNDVFKNQFGPGALEAGQKMRGPLAVTDRYITEDVPFGLVFYASMGRLAGVETPICNALIHMASVINNTDYFNTGRNLKSMGLNEGDRKELLEFLEKGV